MTKTQELYIIKRIIKKFLLGDAMLQKSISLIEISEVEVELAIVN